MPKIREIIQPPPEPEGSAEEQVAALREYLTKITQELYYLLTHLESDNINDSTFQQIYRKIPQPYGGLPLMDGAASSGGSGSWARGDHRHPSDAAKADATALAGHVTDTDNPHEVTKAQVGLGNVANERQYSANNPPPLPTPGDIGAVPESREINGYPLDTDVTIDAIDVGARPNTWMPSKSDIGLGNVANERQYSAQNPPPLPDAEDIIYDNMWSGMAASDVQAAIDELAQSGGGPSPSDTNPLMDGTAAPGIAATYSRSDHVHPHDTRKADVADLPFPSGPDDFPLMDGTAAVGSMDEYARADHVHPNDTTKANQAQLAVVESGSTASVDHAVNTYFCWNGLLYRATAKISTGQSFTPGTNCEAVTAGGELLDRCRTMTAAVPKGKSVDIVITGNNYTPNHGFILLSTGNQLTRMMGAWLCFGLGIRYNYHVIQPLHTSGATSLSLTSTVDGKYTFTNSDSAYDCSLTVAVLQEIGTGNEYLSLSAPY